MLQMLLHAEQHVDEKRKISDNVPVYGARILLGPKRKPDPDKYILWTNSIHLTNTSCYLHGPFNFEPHSDIISAKQHVALTYWEYLLSICNKLSVVSPILSTFTKVKVARKKRKKQTLTQLQQYTHLHMECC